MNADKFPEDMSFDRSSIVMCHSQRLNIDSKLKIEGLLLGHSQQIIQSREQIIRPWCCGKHYSHTEHDRDSSTHAAATPVNKERSWTNLVIVLIVLLVLNFLHSGFLCLIFQVNIKGLWEGYGRQDTYHRGQGQHQTHHDPSKVHSTDGIQQNWKKDKPIWGTMIVDTRSPSSCVW